MTLTGQSDELNDLPIIISTSSLNGSVFDTFKDICKSEGLHLPATATSW